MIDSDRPRFKEKNLYKNFSLLFFEHGYLTYIIIYIINPRFSVSRGLGLRVTFFAIASGL